MMKMIRKPFWLGSTRPFRPFRLQAQSRDGMLLHNHRFLLQGSGIIAFCGQGMVRNRKQQVSNAINQVLAMQLNRKQKSKHNDHGNPSLETELDGVVSPWILSEPPTHYHQSKVHFGPPTWQGCPWRSCKPFTFKVYLTVAEHQLHPHLWSIPQPWRPWPMLNQDVRRAWVWMY